MPGDASQEAATGRSAIRSVDRPPRRKIRDALIVAVIAIVLLLAIVGVVSAGSFVAGKLSGSSSSAAKLRRVVTLTPPSVLKVARAQAQATAIVRSAQTTSRSIVAGARRQAGEIVATARREAAAGSVSQVATPPVSSSGGAATQPTAVPPSGGPSSSGPGIGTGSSAGALKGPSLGGLPANWLVVVYNPIFGHGPGSAGSIMVTDRSTNTGETFSGEARVLYDAGGSARAYFSGLGAGETRVLSLDGQPYPGGSYHYMLLNLRWRF